MKYILLIAYLVSGSLYAQDRTTPITQADLNGRKLYAADFRYGYQTGLNGWIIKAGDTLSLGRGTMPDKALAFLYENPAGLSATYFNGNLVKQYLPSMYADKRVVIKDLGTIGTKKTGFTAVAIVGVGGLVRYQVEIENAIEAGEILPPVQFQQAYAQPPQQAFSVADELIKLKRLMDDGVLSKEEFDAQKKKLLNQ
ncbi:SHOCT domain-containing protein [Spirosoma sp.]|uniref:SHOCT domain-containing protein n=1 Tax=Spirosoma sp. TaxID=1899569 RepID=UPI003B3A89D3